MPIDWDDLKVEKVKRHSQAQEVQHYLEEQDALDKQNATGKLGSKAVRMVEAMRGNIAEVAKKCWPYLFHFTQK